jgi:PAS domain S-box-containing protein
MAKRTYPQRGKTSSVRARPRPAKHAGTEQEHLRQQELLLALEEVSQVLTVEVDLQKILKDMATIVAKAIGAKWVNFWELTDDKKAAHITAAFGMKQSYIDQSREHPIELGKAWIGRAIKTGKAWGTSDILTDPNLMPDLGPTWEKAIKKQAYRALLCVPTISRKGPVGGMCVYYPKPHEFTDFEMRLVTVAANQAATSITNAQIFNDLVVERNKTLATLNSLADGLIVYDLEGRITAFNPKAEELLWISQNDVLNKTPSQIKPKTSPEIKNLQDISYLAINEFESREMQIFEPQQVSLAVTLLPLRDAQDRKIGTMRTLHDITKEREAEQLKSQFVSVASHQLRTPLSGMKWALSLLQEPDSDPLTKGQQDLIRKTEQTNNRLISLVNDLLDTSRIEEGRFGYSFRKLSLEDLVKDVLAELAPAVTSKPGLSVSFLKPKKQLSLIQADRKKLRMAVYNVIDNAIKYTPKGRISIALFPSRSTLTLEVKDEGIGIPRDQQKYLFTKFFRARNAILLETEGSGLGLWIANEIVKRHNGRILLVESQEDKGTNFYLRFPTNPSAMPKGKVEGS